MRGKIAEGKEQGTKVTFDQNPAPAAAHEDPLAMLQKRYIARDISREEFLEMKEDLGL